MATKTLYTVFVLPVIFSIVFSVVVMVGILNESDREVNMWQFGDSGSSDKSIQIIGLAKQYSTSTPVKILVDVSDPFFDCGDLYITVYSSDKSIFAQGGFLDQCFVSTGSQLPLGEGFSQVIDTPGQYELVAEMRDKEQKHDISSSEKFTVK